MIYLKDNGDDWSTLSSDLSTIEFESGVSRPLTSADIEMTAGEYKGQTLSEISDIWYLNFLKKISTEKKDIFLARCVEMRLNEMN